MNIYIDHVHQGVKPKMTFVQGWFLIFERFKDNDIMNQFGCFKATVKVEEDLHGNDFLREKFHPLSDFKFPTTKMNLDASLSYFSKSKTRYRQPLTSCKTTSKDWTKKFRYFHLFFLIFKVF